METNEASPASETNPTKFVKLEEGNKKIIANTCAEVAGPDQRAAKIDSFRLLGKLNWFPYLRQSYF